MNVIEDEMLEAVEVRQSRLPRWVQGLKSPESFQREQAEIGKIWQLVGLTTDLENDGDWFRSTLGGRSIFVQRFREDIRGFENVCVHRSFPLRTEDKGNGTVRCGFHHWQYDKEGCAVGIPKCKELFGVSPQELGARLKTLEIARCGGLLFARFPSTEYQETLEEYLGPGFDILNALWSLKKRPRMQVTDLKANWKLGHHISLDDYHIVAIHPTTLGKNGYLPLHVVKYYRFGRHSAYFYGAHEEAFNQMAEACRNGTYRPNSYRIMQFFPNLVASSFKAGPSYYVVIQQYVPVAHDRTRLLTIFQESPFQTEIAPLKALIRRVTTPLTSRGAFFAVRKLLREDNAACEQMQTIAQQIENPQILGRQEERIRWFEENYADIVGDLN